ncbi:MAG: efflux RND transporter periplasmic adaptor subunit, partial [Gammaproteobacteria bacterium]|nr:efflux RND transporter periplasmic adaptor subunit [Gammaproteobacteria bacterium]
MKRILGLVLLMSAAFVHVNASEVDHIDVQPQQFLALGVTLQQPVVVDVTLGARHPGQMVIPPAQVRIVSAPQAGLLQALLVAEGETVVEGAPLARLESPELMVLQRDYLQTVTQLALALSDKRRDQKLYKEGVIAKRRLLQKQSRYAELQAVEDEGRQTLMLSGMKIDEIDVLKSSRKLSSQLVIRAPADGVVMRRLLTSGEQLDRMTPIYRLAKLEPLWLEMYLPLAQLKGVRVGSVVQLVEPEVQARLILIGREVNPNNQTVMLRAEVTKGVEQLRPGQFVEARLALEAQASQFEVSSSALLRRDGRVYLMVRDASGFVARSVAVVSQQADRALVSGRLKSSDLLAATGVSALKAIWL